jgi:uncharacterized membrane protein YqgA involved in biofilm formation
MIFLGTLVNGIAIILGTIIGLFWTKIPLMTKTTVMQAMALAVIILGIGMGLKSEHFLVVIASLAIGGVIGEKWKLEDRLNQVGEWIERRLGAKKEGSVAKAFVTATLVFVIGALAVIGALDSGLRGDHRVLYTKAVIDGFVSIIFTSALGFGVIFSAIPVMLYQGSIALLATQIDRWVSEELLQMIITEITATGGILILAIGLNLLEIIKIRIVNLLPSILVTIILIYLVYYKANIVSYFTL